MGCIPSVSSHVKEAHRLWAFEQAGILRKHLLLFNVGRISLLGSCPFSLSIEESLDTSGHFNFGILQCDLSFPKLIVTLHLHILCK